MPILAQITELPLLTAADPSLAFNQSREVTVAAKNSRVVVAAIHEHFVSSTSYDPGPNFRKRVAISVSNDAGKTFGDAVDPTFGEQSADPVVRVADDGTFFLAALVVGNNADIGSIGRSLDGVTWQLLASDLPFGDKEWLAVDSANQQIYVVAREGGWRYDFDGNRLGFYEGASTRPLVADAYVVDSGVFLATGGTPNSIVPQVLFWDGTASFPVDEGIVLDIGTKASLYTTITWSRGPIQNGTWSVHARQNDESGSIIVRVERASEIVENALDVQGTRPFLPTAALDSSGRLHIAWYDSSGPSGVLQYTHSVGPAPFAEGFISSIVVDPNACPGGGWYPELDTASGGRRLREYIGLAIDGNDVYIAWTHSPAPPSRVRVAAIRL